MPEFYNDTLLDPKAQCDGNALLLDPHLEEKYKVIGHEVLHISAFLNAQKL